MTSDMQTLTELNGVEAPGLEYLLDMTAQLAPAQQVGDLGRGTRIIFPVTGGAFSGPRLRGRLVPPGGDWLTLRADGTGELDVRATFETDDGVFIYVSYRGYLTNIPAIMPRYAAGETIRDNEVYFRIMPYFETAAPQYTWLTKTVTIGFGRLIPGGVGYRIFAVK
jgi:hypothetical protein